MPSTAETLVAIQHVKGRSMRAVDERRWDDFARCFTADARIDYSRARPGSSVPYVPITSVQAYVDMARAFVDNARTVHQVSMPVIDVLAPDHVRVSWRMEDIIMRPSGSALPQGHGFGNYDDEYRLTDAGWLISALTFTRLLWLPIAPSAGA